MPTPDAIRYYYSPYWRIITYEDYLDMNAAVDHKAKLMQDVQDIRRAVSNLKLDLTAATRLAPELAMYKRLSKLEQGMDKMQQEIMNLAL